MDAVARGGHGAKPRKSAQKRAEEAAPRFTEVPVTKAAKKVAASDAKDAKKAAASAVKEAAREGLILLADAKWTSGYTSVLVDKSTEGLRNRFRVQTRTPDGRRVTIGRFSSAEEAALCYARSDAGKEELAKRERLTSLLEVEEEPIPPRAAAPQRADARRDERRARQLPLVAEPLGRGGGIGGSGGGEAAFIDHSKRLAAERAFFAADTSPASAQSEEDDAEAARAPKQENRGRAVLDALAGQYRNHRAGPQQQHQGRKRAVAGAWAAGDDAPAAQSWEAGASADAELKAPKQENRGRAVLDALAGMYQQQQQHSGSARAAGGDAPKSRLKIRRTTPVQATGATAAVSPEVSPEVACRLAGPVTPDDSFSE